MSARALPLCEPCAGFGGRRRWAVALRACLLPLGLAACSSGSGASATSDAGTAGDAIAASDSTDSTTYVVGPPPEDCGPFASCPSPLSDADATDPCGILCAASDALYLRFALAPSRLSAGTQLDICYAPVLGDAATLPPDSSFVGPLAYQLAGDGAHFTIPSVTQYFRIDPSIAVGPDTQLAVRWVQPGNSCALSTAFSVTDASGKHAVTMQGVAGPMFKGAHTIAFRGDLGERSSYTLFVGGGDDPTAEPPTIELQFFDAFDDGSGGKLRLELDALSGDKVSFTGLSTDGLAVGDYVGTPLALATGPGSLSINGASVSVGSVAPVHVSLPATTLSLSPTWAFAYGTSLTTDIHLYVCPGVARLATASEYAIPGCVISY